MFRTLMKSNLHTPTVLMFDEHNRATPIDNEPANTTAAEALAG